MLSEHLAGFVSVIGLPLAEVDYQENGEHLMKQMLAAQVTIAPWENVLAYVTPGEVESIRFSSEYSIDSYGRCTSIPASFFRDTFLGSDVVYPLRSTARSTCPVFAAFADRVCPDRPLNEQIMFFHMLNAPNQRTLLNELRDDMFQGDVRKVNKMLGDMEKFSAEALKGEDRTELAEEIGRLLTEMHFPPHLFFDRMAIQKEKEEEKATSAVDAKHYPLHFGNTPSAAPIRVLPNMHPVLAALRREIDVPVSFDTAKVAAQFVAGAAGMCSVNDSLLGRKQVRDDVRANASEVISSCKAEDVCNLLDAVASSIPSDAILAHPHTQEYYNALCETCGPQYVQRTVATPQQLYGMMLKAHVAAEHDIQTTDNDKVTEVGKEYAQKESSEELVSLVINGKC